MYKANDLQILTYWHQHKVKCEIANSAWLNNHLVLECAYAIFLFLTTKHLTWQTRHPVFPIKYGVIHPMRIIWQRDLRLRDWKRPCIHALSLIQKNLRRASSWHSKLSLTWWKAVYNMFLHNNFQKIPYCCSKFRVIWSRSFPGSVSCSYVKRVLIIEPAILAIFLSITHRSFNNVMCNALFFQPFCWYIKHESDCVYMANPENAPDHTDTHWLFSSLKTKPASAYLSNTGLNSKT